MNLMTKMILVLTVLTMVAGALLSSWDGYTRPMIEAYRLQELKKAIAEVLPPYESYEELNTTDMTLYIGKNSGETEPVGIAFTAEGNGFQGKISIMVGISTDFKNINKIKILEQMETPGLGTKIIVDPTNKKDPAWFPNQFSGLLTEPQIDVVKNIAPSKPTEIQAITGATISSKAIATILNADIQTAKSIYQSKSQ